MTQQSLQLFDRLKKVQEEEGDEISDRHIELLEEMFTLLARLVECPEHGMPGEEGLEVTVTRKEGKYQVEVTDLCCDKMDRPVEEKIVEFMEEL
jgi:hypothetical protein